MDDTNPFLRELGYTPSAERTASQPEDIAAAIADEVVRRLRADDGIRNDKLNGPRNSGRKLQLVTAAIALAMLVVTGLAHAKDISGSVKVLLETALRIVSGFHDEVSETRSNNLTHTKAFVDEPRIDSQDPSTPRGDPSPTSESSGAASNGDGKFSDQNSFPLPPSAVTPARSPNESMGWNRGSMENESSGVRVSNAPSGLQAVSKKFEATGALKFEVVAGRDAEERLFAAYPGARKLSKALERNRWVFGSSIPNDYRFIALPRENRRDVYDFLVRRCAGLSLGVVYVPKYWSEEELNKHIDHWAADSGTSRRSIFDWSTLRLLGSAQRNHCVAGGFCIVVARSWTPRMFSDFNLWGKESQINEH